jgi:hypothetical protein
MRLERGRHATVLGGHTDEVCAGRGATNIRGHRYVTMDHAMGASNPDLRVHCALNSRRSQQCVTSVVGGRVATSMVAT